MPFLHRLHNISSAPTHLRLRGVSDSTGPCSTASFSSLTALSDFLGRCVSLFTSCLPHPGLYTASITRLHFLDKIYIDCFSTLLQQLERDSPQVERPRSCLAAEVRLAELSDSAQLFGRRDILRASTDEFSTIVSIPVSTARYRRICFCQSANIIHHSGVVAYLSCPHASALVGHEYRVTYCFKVHLHCKNSLNYLCCDRA